MFFALASGLLVGGGVWNLADVVAAERGQTRMVDFTRDIRPVLAENCFHCHGPDPKHREGDLRLDTAAGALTVVDLEHPEQSELLKRLRSHDPDEQMPPPSSNRSVTAAEVDDIARWIAAGAIWGEHWSFAALQKPVIPTRPAVSPGSIHNPIDSFIQENLAQQGLIPNPEADRVTLIRRVTLDLTGLPPSPEEVDQFLADTRPDAYEHLVDRLLDSPAYGERMAWDWLEAARYADSNGYQGDRERTMWPWRDWVVDAFNRNLSYRDFTIWQLAGDRLPNATTEQKLATGFLRNHAINGEGGRIAEENRIDYVFDMTETTATVWLGLTTNCCRCHDHKFDPLTNVDYYSLFAFFNQTPVTGGGGDPQTAPTLSLPNTMQQSRIDEVERLIADNKQRQAMRDKELLTLLPDWEKKRLQELGPGIWTTPRPESIKAEHQTLELQPDSSILAKGDPVNNDTYTVTLPVDLPQLVALRLEALRHESHTQGGLAKSDSGNFVLTEIEIELLAPDAEPQPLKITSAQATFEQGSLKVENAFDGNAKSGWAVLEGQFVNKDHAAIFRFMPGIQLPKGSKLRVTLRHDSQHIRHNMGRFRLSVTEIAAPMLSPETQTLIAALRVAATDRTAEQVKIVATEQRVTDVLFRELQEEQKKLAGQLEEARRGVPKVMVMEDMPQRRKTFRLERGLYSKPGDEVTANVPASLPPLPPLSEGAEGTSYDRLALAEWLVSDDNPLTPRVTVNRFWQQFFGIGLVKTAEDFGVQGEFPVNLDLLNWLAADFREGGWDVKRLVRLIVTSHTYRQSSKGSAELFERDPQNRLLARGSRHRLPSWMIRDQALAASGLLVTTSGGPAVNGYQPAGVWEEATFGTKRYTQDHGEALYRRSLYTFWRRITGPTLFFDTADRLTCSVKVFRTNTPLHALATQNDVTYVEAARALAQQVLLPPTAKPEDVTASETAATDATRLNRVFRRLLARAPSDREQTILLAAIARSRDQFTKAPEEAAKLLAIGESPRDETISPIEHATWTALTLALMNLDETLNRE
ncbi:MAG: PSD1 and planctomycete cytochrome C domain-containing protein [Planctomycetaceae bacterium]